MREDEIELFHDLLGRMRALPADDADRLRAEHAAASFARDGRKRRKAAARRADAAPARRTAPPASEDRPHWRKYSVPRQCALCEARFRTNGFGCLNARYPHLCPACIDAQAARLTARVDLTGATALLTHGHDGPGFVLAWRLLRDGATVVVATPDPERTLKRFDDKLVTSERWIARHGGPNPLARLHAVRADLTVPEDVDRLPFEALRVTGDISLLINSATRLVDPQGSWSDRTEASLINLAVPAALLGWLGTDLSRAPGGGDVITAAPARLDAVTTEDVRIHAVDPGVPDLRAKTPPIYTEDAAGAFYDPIIAVRGPAE